MSAKATSTHTGVAATMAWPIEWMPMRWRASTARPAPAEGAARHDHPSRRMHQSAASGVGALRLQRRKSLRADPRAGLRGSGAGALCEPGNAALRLRSAERLLVDRLDLARHVRPCEALGALERGLGHLRPPLRVRRQLEQRLAQRHGVADGHERAVDAVADDVAVARDVGGDRRRTRGECLREHHPEALAAQRRRAEHVRLAEQCPLVSVVDLARDLDALRIEQQRLDLLGSRAGDREPRGHAHRAQRLEGAQEDGEPLPLLGTPHEDDPQLVVRVRVVRSRRRQVDAVRDDPVAAAVVALCRPLGSLGDRDASAQLRVEPPHPGHVRCEAVDHPAGGVGVERADGRHRRGLGRIPGCDGRIRLVYVHHVVAAVAELLAQRHDCLGEGGQVRHRAVQGDADGAPQRDHVIGQRSLLRARAAVGYTCQPVIGVVRRHQPDLVAQRGELLGQSLHMTPDSARIRVGIGRDERYTHTTHPIGHTCRCDSRAELCEVHLHKGRPRLAPALERGTHRRQARVCRGLQRIRGGSLPPRLHAGRHAR